MPGTPRHGFTIDGKGPFIIGVAGGTASGKSSVCKNILDQISNCKENTESDCRKVISLSLDQFYQDLTIDNMDKARKGLYNLDHPDAFDLDLIMLTMQQIKEGKSVTVPVYDYSEFKRLPEKSVQIEPASVVFVEGILAFYWPELRNMYDMKLFVDTDADTRLSRRVTRDVNEHGRTLDTVLIQYVNTVKPAFEDFCLPTKKFADIIIPRGADNTVAIDLIAQSISELLTSRTNQVESRPTLVQRKSQARLH